ncbi:MAG: hypothetical protein ACXVW6_11685, partial [Nocardioidaceae bacterium]
IAQLVVQQVERARFTEAETLPDSVRGVGGYGSTGGFAAADQVTRGNAVTGTRAPATNEETQ